MASCCCPKSSLALYQDERMKSIHIFALASTVASFGLLAFGASGAAGLVLGLGIVVEIVGSILIGKQSNEGTD